jgi:hypothetical protein
MHPSRQRESETLIVLAAAFAIGLCFWTEESSAQNGSVQLTLKMRLAPIGEAKVDHNNRLRFPRMPKVPGIYRVVIRAGEITQCYVGESSNLNNRFRQYRALHSRRGTNERVPTAISRALKANGVVKVEIGIEDAWICEPSCRRADLSSKNDRLLFERLAIFKLGCDLNIDRPAPRHPDY